MPLKPLQSQSLQGFFPVGAVEKPVESVEKVRGCPQKKTAVFEQLCQLMFCFAALPRSCKTVAPRLIRTVAPRREICYNKQNSKGAGPMEPQKLYYEDPMCRTFTARVLSCRPSGALWAVALDRTAFFPGGGGQHCDTGFLEDVPVTEVLESGSEVVHLCTRPLPEGSQVTGTVDFQRRLDGMQQHTGEHILAGLIFRDFGYHNVGFHIGEAWVEVDFDGPIPADALARLEAEANAIVWQDLPLKTWTPEPDQLSAIPYRTKKDLSWPVRLVQIPGVDSCACCGVHVPRTGQVGLIRVLSCVRFHQGVRLQLVCGARAYRYTAGILEQNRQISQALSVPPEETAEGVRRLQQQLAEEKYRSVGLQRRLFAALGDSCAGVGDVLRWEPDLDPAAQRALAEALADRCGGAAVVLSPGTDGVQLCALGPRERIDALSRALRQRLSARGGGRPGAFQGTVLASREETETLIREVLQES